MKRFIPRTAFHLVAPLLLLTGSAIAQTPHLAGRVDIDPGRGILAGQLCLSRFAPRSDLRFVLSAALNVKTVTDSTGRPLPYNGEYNGRILGEAREYIVVQRDSARRLGHLCVAYRGAVPPFDVNTATMDWKGRLTSIGGVLRAAEQSRWHPTLLDSASGRLEQYVTYNLNVGCPACEALYVNGSRPVAAQFGNFTSDVPRQVLLLAGKFTFSETPEITFVGGPAGSDAAREFSKTVREIAEYYSRLLGMPYRDRPTLLTFRSVWSERPDGRPMWQFVTWPTIAMSGAVAFDSVLVFERGSRRVPRDLWTTLSHEMGHYYFGTVLDPIGPLRWFALESTAEYLSLKALAALRGPVAVTARTLGLVQSMGTETLPSLDRVRRVDDITGTYRYQYAPAFLRALELQHGPDRVIGMLRELLATPRGMSIDFERLAVAAERAGLPRGALTTRWTVADIQAAHAAPARAMLAGALSNPETVADGVAIAGSLVSIDTTPNARLSVLAELRGAVQRDSMLLAAHYQIGRISALTGSELAAGQASLELYLRQRVLAGAPSHAAAYWRLGQIEEHRGRTDRARAMYVAALERDPAYAQAKTALDRLGPPR